MQKINFNDRYDLTQAVIAGRKIMTRRLINLNSTSDVPVRIFAGYIQIIGRSGNVCVEKKLSYKVGEIVAVAQRYEDVEELSYLLRDPFSETYFEEVNIGDEPGYRNKMFVKAELMPHQIRITGIKCERLQDISEEDCMKEGILGDVEYDKYEVYGLFGNSDDYIKALAACRSGTAAYRTACRTEPAHLFIHVFCGI